VVIVVIDYLCSGYNAGLRWHNGDKTSASEFRDEVSNAAAHCGNVWDSTEQCHAIPTRIRTLRRCLGSETRRDTTTGLPNKLRPILLPLGLNESLQSRHAETLQPPLSRLPSKPPLPDQTLPLLCANGLAILELLPTALCQYASAHVDWELHVFFQCDGGCGDQHHLCVGVGE